MSDLVERVARAICTADEQNGGPPWDNVKSRLKHADESYRDRARAAIAIALEEAARVCEVDWDSESKAYGRVFAAAIRGLSRE